MKRLLISFVLALALLVVPAAGALAATDTVTVTATPSFIGISNSPNTWILNGITGDSTIQPDTIYYSNPGGDTTAPSATVVDGECRFTITNNSSEATNVVIDIDDFTGGDDNMTNSDLGTNDTTSFGAYSWYSGMTYTGKVIAKKNATGSDNLISSLAADTDLKWGMEIETQSNAWTGSTSSTATITITVTQV